MTDTESDALDFRDHFPRLNPRKLAWANYAYAYLVDGLDGLATEKELNTSVRIRRGEGHFSVGPRPFYLSVYFTDPSYAKLYRKQSGRLATGKYTINIPYFDDEELDAVRALVHKALGA